MTTKLLMAFLIVFVGTTFLGSILSGGGGIVSTTLDSDLASDDDFIPADTSIFSNKDVLMLSDEKVLYTSKNSTGFIVYERGYDDTTAVNHTAGTVIYTESGGILNAALGYNVGVELETSGSLGIIQLPIRFFTTTLPHLVVLNANFLQDNAALQMIGVFWLVAGIALLIDMSIRIAPIAISAARAVIGFIRG